MEFFTALYSIRTQCDLSLKATLLGELVQRLVSEQKTDADHAGAIEPVGNPSFAKLCRIVPGSQVEKRRNLGTDEGRAIFLHALAHIEYSAIDLALDSAYRFRYLPPQFYEDWLAVACDEARHFTMLRVLLQAIGYDYGSFSVHTGIHDAMARSAHALRGRMAATHRHLEAGGLDAHPELARKFSEFRDGFALEISRALKIIFDDEILHVRAGDFWFRYACGADSVSTEVFAHDVTHAIPGVKMRKKNLNLSARKEAGFTDSELAALTMP